MDQMSNSVEVLEEFEELDKILYEEYRNRFYTVLAEAEELRKLLCSKKVKSILRKQAIYLRSESKS